MPRLPTPERVRENRLRRMLHRQGFALTKARRRDPLAVDYGLYTISGDRGPVADGLTMDEAERWATEPKTRR